MLPRTLHISDKMYSTAIASIGRIVAVNRMPGNIPVDFTCKAILVFTISIVDTKLTCSFLGYAVDAIIWYSVEPGVAIVCACLACIGPLFRRPFTCSRRIKASSTSGSSLDNNTRTTDADDASIIRRLGATCQTSICTAAGENTSEHHTSETQASIRGGSDCRIYVRSSTRVLRTSGC